MVEENSGNASLPILADWWYIDSSLIPEQAYNYLNVSIENENGEVETFPVWSESYDENENKIISFPRYCEYGKILFDNSSSNPFIDCSTEGEEINFNMKVEPRDKYQQDAINALIASTNGICQAKTAFGKTYVAINVISKIKRKALILVHKIALAEQWKNDILEYTDLTENDISILQGNSTKYNLNVPIVISTVQNFVAKNNSQSWELRDKLISANFGVTFFDEVHATAGPLAFVQSTRWFASKRIYGLSATPTRGDEFDKMIKWTVGDVLYKDARPMLPVYLSFVGMEERIPIKKLTYFKFGNHDFMRRYLEWFSKTETYKTTVVKLLVDLIKMNKHVLAVGAYKVILDDIYNLLQEELVKENIPASKVILCHGTSDAKLFDLDCNKHSCVISTNKYFSDGLSVAWLDTLVYLTPPSSKSLVNIPQIVGRIVRNYEGKEFVTVYDLYNSGYDVECMRKLKRCDKYKEFGYHILDVKGPEYAQNMENSVKDVEVSIL